MERLLLLLSLSLLVLVTALPPPPHAPAKVVHLTGNALEPPPPPPPPAVTDVTNPRCSAFICGIELCLPIEDCDGEVRSNATECGCCPLCVKYLDEGRACGKHGVLRFPEQPTTMCRPPLQCIDGYCLPPHASHPRARL